MILTSEKSSSSTCSTTFVDQTKNLSILGGAFERNCGSEEAGGNLNQPILSPQKVKYPSEGMLKLRTDRRILDKMDPHKATKKTVIHRREF